MPTVPMRSCPSSCTTASPSCVLTGESSRLRSSDAPGQVAVGASVNKRQKRASSLANKLTGEWNQRAPPATVLRCQIRTTSTKR
jgi:hypothetical protein